MVGGRKERRGRGAAGRATGEALRERKKGGWRVTATRAKMTSSWSWFRHPQRICTSPFPYPRLSDQLRGELRSSDARVGCNKLGGHRRWVWTPASDSSSVDSVVNTFLQIFVSLQVWSAMILFRCSYVHVPHIDVHKMRGLYPQLTEGECCFEMK